MSATELADKLKAPFPNTSRGRKQKPACLRNHAIVQGLYSTAGRANKVATLSRSSVDGIQIEHGDSIAGRSKQPVPIEIIGKGGRARPIFLTPARTFLDQIRMVSP